jgi:phosphoserine phosphatase RsbU/P
VREQELAQQELTLARAIQERLLPPPELSMDGCRVTARNVAAQFVAGDFYDLIPRPDGSVMAVVADVAGKGVAASLIMASVKSILPMIAASESPVGTLRRLNEKLARELGKREFVALSCALYDPATRRVVLANAGLPDPYLIRDGAATPLAVPGPRFPLGIRANLEYQSTAVELRPGDRLLLLTDGLPEAPLADDEPLGYERFAAIAARPHDSLEALFAAVEAAAPGPRNDDWTAVLLAV